MQSAPSGESVERRDEIISFIVLTTRLSTITSARSAPGESWLAVLIAALFVVVRDGGRRWRSEWFEAADREIFL